MASQEEFLACVIARLIGDARCVAIGASSPIPATAAFLARLQNPGLKVLLHQRRRGNPFSEGSRELFDMAGQGRIDVFFLGGAQIDGRANINLVRAEGRRFPGSFGSAFMYRAAKRTILFREEHSRRTLVPKVEFVSAAGDPQALMTGKALFSWHKGKRRFRLESFHPGSSLDEVKANTGFEFDVAADLTETPGPDKNDLIFLKSKVKLEITVNYPDFARRVWG